MSANSITSGDELVKEFLESIASDPDVDATTLSCIQTLRNQGKLSKNRLLTSLQTARAGDNTDDKDKDA